MGASLQIFLCQLRDGFCLGEVNKAQGDAWHVAEDHGAGWACAVIGGNVWGQ